jgi:hypothetical protein
MKKLGKYSFGHGDRFSLQGKAQLAAIIKAHELGKDITPVWNKSYREHKIVNSHPRDTRFEADSAVKTLDWKNDYFVDADHIGLKTVDLFLEYSDFFTLDVADFIGQKAEIKRIEAFIQRNQRFNGNLLIPDIGEELNISQ